MIDIWAYLSTSPLLGLTLTLVVYQGAVWAHEKSNFNPLVNPVFITVLTITGLLLVFGIGYKSYFQGAKFIHFLLGPATVALAVPLYQHFHKVRKSLGLILISLLCGSITAIASVVGIAWAMGASSKTLLSLAPKSVTTPIAMGISEITGGIPSLTAVFVILTGILGTMFGPLVLDLLRIKDWRARGLAMGTASHGIGTAQALQANTIAGAFAGLAMGLNGLATAVLLPLVIGLF